MLLKLEIKNLFCHIFLQLKRFHSLTLKGIEILLLLWKSFAQLRVEECNLIISLALCGSNALVASQAGWSQKTISSHHFSVEDHIHFNPGHSNFHFLIWLYRKILGPVPIKIRFKIICFIVCQSPVSEIANARYLLFSVLCVLHSVLKWKLYSPPETKSLQADTHEKTVCVQVISFISLLCSFA